MDRSLPEMDYIYICTLSKTVYEHNDMFTSVFFSNRIFVKSTRDGPNLIC